MLSQSKKLRFYNFVTRFLPGRMGLVRVNLLRWCGLSLGRSVRIVDEAMFFGDGKFVMGDNVTVRGDVRFESDDERGGIRIGDGSEINHGTYLAANRGSHIVIGKHCRIAHFVSLKTAHHSIDPEGKCIAGESLTSDIEIGDGSWLCAGCVVIPGVKVGQKNVIAAGAVVTKNTEPGVLMAGVPASVKKRY